jgi:DMSO/TMAO reductase YedYZ molybdopterin-dependent catalytic subunit
MSYQGHERHRRRRGKDPDGSRPREPRQDRNTGTYWAGGGQQNGPARPGATDYQDPAAYRDSADSARSQNGGPEAAGGYQGGSPGGGYEDPGAFPGTAARQGAGDPGSAPFPGPGYPGNGYDGSRYPSAGYNGPDYSGSGFPATGYSGSGYSGSGFPAAEHDGSGFPATGYNGSGYPGSGYQNAGYQESGRTAPGYEQAGAYQPAGYPGADDPDYPDDRGYRAATAYREPAAPGGLAREPGGDQDPARDGGYLPAGEHPSLPGVKLADLEPKDPTAYEGLEGYLRGDGTGRADASMWRRRGHGFLAGICTGLLAGGVAIGMAALAAAFVRPQASPVIAVGDAVLGGASQPVKAAALQSFGENYKVLLLVVIYAVIALLVMGFGLLARRRLAGGVIGMAALGAVGAFVALTRPESHAADVIPSLVGGAAGVVALALLVRAGEPQLILAAAARRAREGHPAAGEPEVVGTNRRNFLLAGLSAAGVAVLAGVAGQVLSRQLFTVGGSQNAVALPPGPVQKAPPLQPGAELDNIPGISPFYTPNATFYRVDTALVVPQVTTAQWELRIHGMVDKPVTINFNDLLSRPQIQRDITICCVSESVGGGFIGNARYQGTLLASLLREAGVHPAATQIVMRDVQGMAIGVSTEAVMDGRDAMLAVAVNGAPLPAEHGFPVRVVVPGLYGYVSACKWVVDMELTTYAAYDAYWVKRGWSEQAAVKTESRIDTPKAGRHLAAGQLVVAGVAWAMHKGIVSVQVGIDGAWQEATLATQDTIDTWRQWYYHWDAAPGTHKIQVRATDQTGYTQTAVVQAPEPNGATGYHTIEVTVA